MFKAIKYVMNQNFSNLYRIYSIARFELLDEMRSNKMGMIWNFLSPTIQIFTYWLIFGLAWQRKPMDVNGIEVPYLAWLVVGYACWWFVQPCLTNGCKAISSKISIIENMVFPVAVLPATIVCKELFNHGCMCIIALVTLFLSGYTPNIYWLQIIYYMFGAFCISEAMSLILSVLTMKARDTHKWVVSITRMLFYFTPLIWNCEFSNKVPHHELLSSILKMNPYYYLVTGYRDSIFYSIGFWEHKYQTVYFWVFTLVMMVIGCWLMYKYRDKFVNLK